MTLYCFRYRSWRNGEEHVYHYDSMTARALAIISLSGYGDILATWEA